MITVVALLLATAFPSNSKTSWMRPESFHLAIGMSRTEALKAVAIYKPQEKNDEAVFDYNDSEGVTLQFHGDRLHAVRFEYFAFLQDARAAFQEERAWLQTTFGPPKKTTPELVIYDDRLPNVMAVLSANPNSEQGRKGIGMLVVRYYDPVTVKKKSEE
jgi:hypothetical protein